MKKTLILITILVCTIQAWSEVVLYDWGFNINGTISLPTDPLPGSIDASLFDWNQGIGTLSLYYNPGAAGDYSILSFFDHELDQTENTYSNEYGLVSGTPDDGQVWEIDEPGWTLYGDIYDHLLAGNLENKNSISELNLDDVAMAMGWQFSLQDGEYANITFNLQNDAPTQGFYLAQFDKDSDSKVFFSSTLNIAGTGPQPPTGVPEPGTAGLLIIGLMGMIGMRKIKKVNV
jgi:hypothetical protein